MARDIPLWARLNREFTIVWVEDDCDVRSPDHEGIESAYLHLFNNELKNALSNVIDKYDFGDAVYYLLPNNIIVIMSYPGNSEIRKLK